MNVYATILQNTIHHKAQTRLQHFSKIVSYLLLQNVKIKSFMANRT